LRISILVGKERVQHIEGGLVGLRVRASNRMKMDSIPSQVPYSALSLPEEQESMFSGEFTHPLKYKRKVFSLAWPVVLLIRCYQILIPDRVKRRCIYLPTCSRYAIVCLERDGLIEGLREARARIARCNGSLFHSRVDPP
jgi:putative membrane protein insertion efficiency factor